MSAHPASPHDEAAAAALWVACLPSRPQPAPVAAALAAFAPTVATLEDGWVAELTRTQRLFGGRGALLRRLLERLRALGWARLGAAPTPLAALALARSTPAAGGLRHALPPRWPAALDALPAATLGAAARHATTLQALGLRTLGALRALAAELAPRTEPALPLALRQCYGEAALPLVPWQPPAAWQRTLELPAPATDASALAFAAQRLLGDLLAWLRTRQLGVLRWALDWSDHEPGLLLTHREPVQDGARLQRLLHERLARLTLPRAVQRLTLRTLLLAPWQPTADSLLAGAGAAPASAVGWDAVLERLTARLGPARVRRPGLYAVWHPHQASVWEPAADTVVAAAPELAPDAAWQPPWWLPQARPLATDARGRPLHDGRPLRRLHGPLRLRHSADGTAQRACIALDPHGQPWWLEHSAGGRWLAVGVYA
ncbi:hypothetical protein Tsedi_00998 [Tepidimonas sediminis]|uniref:DNA polymerase Y family protein n=1 Tax=Tepidimonas sediminis TaxID=2588941 RepID=A0A554WRJ1_9BURK|nr:hypothetical protein [Tepidimonas sediminis]TSE26183.1 hypothetical protein Tsedi_00998 [Tepidimonas sediminis]